MSDTPADSSGPVVPTPTHSSGPVVHSGGVGRPRIVLITGPSGAGKSRLSERLKAAHGWPIVRLDDFYRELDDPGLPRSPLGIPDWDHPDSWNAESAVDSLRSLVETGRCELPVYDIGRSAITGHHVVTADSEDVILAEGLFAARLIAPLTDEGLLADAVCVCRNRWTTFTLRLTRDLSERRKPPHILLRRGIALLRDEPTIVGDAVALGARTASPKQAEQELASLISSAT
ncbi:MAG: uridine kinase [Dermatophilaceae bacterium]